MSVVKSKQKDSTVSYVKNALELREVILKLILNRCTNIERRDEFASTISYIEDEKDQEKVFIAHC